MAWNKGMWIIYRSRHLFYLSQNFWPLHLFYEMFSNLINILAANPALYLNFKTSAYCIPLKDVTLSRRLLDFCVRRVLFSCTLFLTYASSCIHVDFTRVFGMDWERVFKILFQCHIKITRSLRR